MEAELGPPPARRRPSRRVLLGAAAVAVVVVAGIVGAVLVVSGGGGSSSPVSLEKCSTPLGATGAPSGADAGPTSLSVRSSPMTAGQHGDTIVTAHLAASDSVNAFDVTVAFDPRIVKVDSICLDDNWRQSLTARWDNSGGSLRVAGFRLGSGCAGNTDCPLFKITWTGQAPGSSPLAMNEPKLAGLHDDLAGLVPAASPEGAAVDVG
ncbi:MAG: cohesin domain-containing protein [Tepidiformaceae bacterium]